MHSRSGRWSTKIKRIVAVALPLIVAIGGLLLLSSCRHGTKPSTVTRQIAALLREARSRSMKGENGAAWGVHFANDVAGKSFCALFAGSYAPGTVARYQTLPAGVRFESSSVPAGGTLDILFARTSGLPSTSTSIGVERATGGAAAGTSSVFVHTSGRSEINGAPATAAPDITPPSVPRGLSASTVTTSAVTLLWSPSSDPDSAVAGYKIFRNGTQVGTAMTNSYTDFKLSPSTSYTYTVAAYDAAGNISARTAGLVATTRAPLSPSSTSLLRVSSSNPRYFQNASGKIVYLTGSHNWDYFQDGAKVGQSIQLFDYKSYVKFMQGHNMNFMRFWSWEGWSFCRSMTSPSFSEPLAYPRTGPGNALDGGLRYDLNQFNQAYFDRLRTRVEAARAGGIYVSIMLFQGWSTCSKGAWRGHPYNVSNNINGVDGDYNGDGAGIEIHSLQNGLTIDALQKAYIRKVVDTVNDLDNVLFEVENEENPDDNVSWQDYVVQYIKSYEATMPHQHPVGITTPLNSSVKPSELFASSADWISPATGRSWGDYRNNPPVATGQKVVMADTDHIFGVGGDGTWVWKNFMRGNNPIFMDDLSQRPKLKSARVAMGQTRSYADRINLSAMTPSTTLCSSKYCLVNNGTEYLVYQPGRGSFTVNLSAGSGKTFSVEWLNVRTNTTRAGPSIKGGRARQSFSPPFPGDAVLYLKTR
ncbi:MAG: DUF6298 domain-containing protein [Acidobacteriota bacterium]